MFLNHEYDDHEMRSTPKLPLFSFPAKRVTYPPWLATPPVNVAGAVPFLWEEAPGKPRRWHDRKTKQYGVGRRLELPRRISSPGEGGKTTANEPSSTTVLGGPFFDGRSSLSLPRKASRKNEGSSLVKRGPKKSKEVAEGKFDFSSFMVDCRRGGCDCRDDVRYGGCGGIKMKISRLRRKRSLHNLPHAKSHVWARIYERFKEVISWSRRKENLRRTNSSTT